MTINEIRQAVREVIAEVKKEGSKKSGGKLVELKKELKSLQAMKEALAQYAINEGTAEPVVEFAHLQRFVNEMAKIKAAHSKLAEMLDNQISEVEGKVIAETQKIKEMMGLVEPQAEVKKKKSAKKKEEPKEEKEEIEEARFKKGEDVGKPGKGFAKIAKSAAKQYGSEEAGKRVAGAILKKVVKKGE